jgi:hypothetical protein
MFSVPGNILIVIKNSGRDYFMPLIYFEVICAKCGRGLCNLTTVDERSGVTLEIKPCPECLKNAESDGFDKGFSKGCEAFKEQA